MYLKNNNNKPNQHSINTCITNFCEVNEWHMNQHFNSYVWVSNWNIQNWDWKANFSIYTWTHYQVKISKCCNLIFAIYVDLFSVKDWENISHSRCILLKIMFNKHHTCFKVHHLLISTNAVMLVKKNLNLTCYHYNFYYLWLIWLKSDLKFFWINF